MFFFSECILEFCYEESVDKPWIKIIKREIRLKGGGVIPEVRTRFFFPDEQRNISSINIFLFMSKLMKFFLYH